jgi:GNAT superfamily N-acetyltransferase/RimJ/RimL family protein N-acetyltransferase
MSSGFGQTATPPAIAPPPSATLRRRRLIRLPGAAGLALHGGMRLERFDPAADDERLAACHEISEACRVHDDPDGFGISLAWFRYTLTEGRETDRRETWLALHDGRPAGYCRLHLSGTENLSRAGIGLKVAPALRRRGTGTALLRHCARRARAAGATLLYTETVDGSAGEAFARAAGATADLAEVRRAMPFGAGTAGLLARLRAQAEPAAAGYALTRWQGATPAADLDQMSLLYSAMADAPLPTGQRPEPWDGARVGREEQHVIAAGAQLYQVAAWHSASGRLAAMSLVSFDPADPELGHQGNTVVVREHRGHRLGLLVKTALYQWLAESRPGTRRIMTWNASSNQYMGAINEQLGFSVSGRFHGWELGVDKVPGG